MLLKFNQIVDAKTDIRKLVLILCLHTFGMFDDAVLVQD